MDKFILTKDIIIKKGTIFQKDGDSLIASFGLTKNTYGDIIYYLDDTIDLSEKKELASYFDIRRK